MAVNLKTETISFDTSGNFTFDSDDIEFTGSVAQLKRFDSLSGEIAFASFDSSVNLDRGQGITTATSATATIDVANQRLNCTGGGQVKYNEDNLDAIMQSGTIRFKVTPNYTGSPSAAYFLADFSSGSLLDRVFIRHQATGSLEFFMYGDSGNIFALSHAWAPSSGTEYEIEVGWDLTNGLNYLAIDGTIEASNSITDSYNTNSIVEIIIGGTGADFFMRDLQIYNEQKHITNFTSEIPRTVPTYIALEGSIQRNATIAAEGLEGFEEDSSTPAGTSVRHILVADGVDKYWNGSAWVNSDGTYNQANEATVINANFSSVIGSGTSGTIKTWLKSDSFYTTPTITSVSITYDFFADITDPETCTVYGKIFDGTTAISGASVKFLLDPVQIGESIVSINEETTTDPTGYFDIDLPKTATIQNKVRVTIEYTDSNSRSQRSELFITVKDQASMNLNAGD